MIRWMDVAPYILLCPLYMYYFFRCFVFIGHTFNIKVDIYIS
jgi:hypothetical protein